MRLKLIILGKSWPPSETMQLRWDVNPRLLIEITHLLSGLNEAQVLDVSSQREFSERQNNR